MDTARINRGLEPEPRLSISSVNTELAGSNRSCKHRLLPDQAEESGAAVLPAGLLPDQAETGDKDTAEITAEHTASRGLPGTTTDIQVVVGGGDSHPLDSGEVHQSLVDSDQGQTRVEMSDESAEMAAAKTAAELAAAQVGGGGNEVVIIEPSPTNFDQEVA